MSAAWTDLGGGIRVRQSAAFWMNSVVLLDREHSWLIDPGVLPSELDDIAAVVAAVKPAQLSLFLTHAHWDHVIGRPWWPTARVVAHDSLRAETTRDAAKILGKISELAIAHGESWTRGFSPSVVDDAVSGLRFVKAEPWRLVFRDAPGHALSQLTMHLPDARVLIAADMLSDVEIPSLDGPPERYRETLEPLLPLAEHGAIETLVPGHGAIAHGRDAVLARFEHDLGYLEALTREVAEARGAGADEDGTVARLDAMHYTGKGDAVWDTTAFHRENVRQAFRAATRPRPGSRPLRR